MIDSAAQSLDISREALFESRLSGKRNNSRFVFVWPQHVFKKRACGFFFVWKGALFGSTRVDQDREREWQIDVLLKSENLLRLSVFQHANVFRFKIVDEASVLVRRREKDVGQISFYFNNFIR